MRRVLETPSEDAAVLYCETNSTTHLTVRIRVDQGRWMHQIEPLEKVKKLAMLVLAFEPEIDKMLADHVGYINEDVRRHQRDRPFMPLMLWAGFGSLQCQQHRSLGTFSEIEAAEAFLRQVSRGRSRSYVPYRPFHQQRGLERVHCQPPKRTIQIQFPTYRKREPPIRGIPSTPRHSQCQRGHLLDQVRRWTSRLSGQHRGQ